MVNKDQRFLVVGGKHHLIREHQPRHLIQEHQLIVETMNKYHQLPAQWDKRQQKGRAR
jgi:hypothetical protein